MNSTQSSMASRGLFAVYGSYRMLVVLFLGFSSGLPLLLTGGTLQAWLTDAKVDLATIGKFALVGLPYTLKFVWAPFFDSVKPPFLTRRRGWGIVTQLLLIASLVLLAYSDPFTSLNQMVFASLLVAFFSASQDIVIDALRIEMLEKNELGAGGSVNTIGYRIAMILSGAMALAMADRMTWQAVYLIMAAFQAIGIFAFLRAPEPVMEVKQYVSFKERVTIPFLDFLAKGAAMEILLFVMLYKLPTLMATALTTPFLMTLEFSKTEIGLVGKLYGLIAGILGAFIGGGLMSKWGIKRSLWIFGFLQAIAGLSFIVLSENWYGFHLSPETAQALLPENWAMLKRLLVEPKHFAMLGVIIVDNFMMGLGATSLVAFAQSVCSKQFSASQYALLSSLTAVSRVILVSQAGVIAETLGWTKYFLFSMVLAAPGMLMLLRFNAWASASEEFPEGQGGKNSKKISPMDLFLLSLLLGSLLLMSSDPVWTAFGYKDTGRMFAWVGAIGVIASALLGFFRPKR